jgi:tetratricopeptide (TPR) repeat protein
MSGTKRNHALACALAWAVLLPAMAAAGDTALPTLAAPCSDASQRKDEPACDRDPASLQMLRQQLVSAYAMSRNGQHTGALLAFESAIADPLFAGLDAADQRSTLSAAAKAANRTGDLKRARALYRRATTQYAMDPDDVYRLSLVEYELKHYRPSMDAYLELVERWPELLDETDAPHFYRLYRAIENNPDDGLRLLQAMFDAKWDDPTNDSSWVWFELARMRMIRGEHDLARLAVKRITAPAQIVRMRVDKRFDPIVDRSARAFDVNAAALRAVDAMHRKSEAKPLDLDVQVQYTYALLDAGRNDDVVAHVGRLLDTIAAGKVDEPLYRNTQEQVWLMNNRAIAMRRLGRLDEAIAEMQRASALTEDGQINVSQALNLGTLHCSLGRPDDALAAIDTLGQMSPYGELVESMVRLRAALQKGDRRRAGSALNAIRRNSDESPTVLLDALMHAGRVAEAAGTIVDLLESSDQRTDILDWLQQYRRSDPLPGDLEYRSNIDAVREREEVRAAVDKVGRIERHDIYGNHGFE